MEKSGMVSAAATTIARNNLNPGVRSPSILSTIYSPLVVVTRECRAQRWSSWETCEHSLKNLPAAQRLAEELYGSFTNIG